MAGVCGSEDTGHDEHFRRRISGVLEHSVNVDKFRGIQQRPAESFQTMILNQ
jgi:hypothetical protein